VHASRRLQSLIPHAARLVDRPLRELVAGDPGRASDFALRVGPLQAHFGRQRLDRGALDALFGLADELDLAAAMRRLMAGEPVNASESRAALHTALRGDPVGSPASRAARADALAARQAMGRLCAELRAGPVTDVVNIGIGGSDLGPRLVVDALGAASPTGLRLHFLANVDGHAAQRLLAGLDPSRTAAIVVSKSFGTRETLTNAAIVRDWMGAGAGTRLYAVSADPARAAGFGIAAGHVLPMREDVGGRYSLWSTVGFSIALALGEAGFDELLAGAAAFDRHALTAPPRENLAFWHALCAVWNRNALGLDTVAVVPYDERLALLPAYLQQLVMESLGKSVTPAGDPVAQATSPVLWGGAGTSVQHSFFQALHQGTDTVPVDFIGVRRPDHPHAGSHTMLLANLLAQSQALANGEDSEDPQRHYRGGRPSTVILLDRLDPHALGMLLALYEHSTYLQGVVWDINPFDQWGVELGKRIADGLEAALGGGDEAGDPVTAALVRALRGEE